MSKLIAVLIVLCTILILLFMSYILLSIIDLTVDSEQSRKTMIKYLQSISEEIHRLNNDWK